MKPLCEVAECPKGHWSDQKGFTTKNKIAYAFHMECRAVNQWPDDPIVRRNARIIEDVLANVRR